MNLAMCVSTSILPTFPVLHILNPYFLAHSVLNQYPQESTDHHKHGVLVCDKLLILHPPPVRSPGTPILLSQQFSYRNPAIVGHLTCVDSPSTAAPAMCYSLITYKCGHTRKSYALDCKCEKQRSVGPSSFRCSDHCPG
ncbi:hypothetical protein PV10_02792 [Exophiala mesophila]|uniref:Uncharacterized protein n=1 Tax=Exophiala mesophila TaxID=212818 RepID=A0A0D1X023_EXOME|nr:uncharacterized protein PV10_02792 [Exophiala mesophila]KIV95100.1 hypothetical protein PV10_02792 [Exophiala mesophila]